MVPVLNRGHDFLLERNSPVVVIVHIFVYQGGKVRYFAKLKRLELQWRLLTNC